MQFTAHNYKSSLSKEASYYLCRKTVFMAPKSRFQDKGAYFQSHRKIMQTFGFCIFTRTSAKITVTLFLKEISVLPSAHRTPQGNSLSSSKDSSLVEFTAWPRWKLLVKLFSENRKYKKPVPGTHWPSKTVSLCCLQV